LAFQQIRDQNVDEINGLKKVKTFKYLGISVGLETEVIRKMAKDEIMKYINIMGK
jgi:hypothetical protein